VSEASRAGLVVKHRSRLRLSREATSKVLRLGRTGWGVVAAVASAALAAGGVVGFVLGWLVCSRMRGGG
jgi:hypothetical protein